MKNNLCVTYESHRSLGLNRWKENRSFKAKSGTIKLSTIISLVWD
jgi:hypothetical protein